MTAKSPNAPPPAPDATRVLEPPDIARILERMAGEIRGMQPDLSRLTLVGIPSRGVELSRRLANLLGGVQTGIVDVSMHRDDIHLRARLPQVMPTDLPENLSEQTILLVDDVLFSGRTCRAALDALSSFGRPARIQLAVLIDRGGRELPIQADFVGKVLPTTPKERVFVRLEETDQQPDGVWLSGGAVS